MNDRDEAEKNKAGRSREASRRPGAESVEQISQLDERIASKQARNAQGKVGPRNDSDSRPNTERITGKSNKINQLESNAASKTAAVNSQALYTNGNEKATQLAQLEDDITKKHSVKGPAAMVAGYQQDSCSAHLSQMEEDVISKINARSSSRSQGNRVDRDIVAKNNARNAGKSELDALEDRIALKTGQPSKSQSVNPRTNKIHDFVKESQTQEKNQKPMSEKDDPNQFEQEYPTHEDKVFGQEELNHRGITTTADHGISNQPGLEYGVFSGDGHGYGDSLAVAIAVADDEEDAFIPAAIEFDPDSKPPLYKNRRFRFYLIAAIILLAAVGVGTALTVTSAQKEFAPTMAPTTKREGGIMEQALTIVGSSALEDPKSPHAKAANWIMNEDLYMISPEAENFIQRYLLAHFYFATTETSPWLSCNAVPQAENQTCEFTRIVQVFPEVQYENITWGRWLSYSHECEWAGVLCDEFNQTRAIELPGLQIRSTFPTEVALMPYLQSLTFNYNEFHGTLPSEFAQMKHLLNIELHYNFFTGQVPPEWYTAQALQRINFAGNYLSGTIPTEIGRLTTMKGFFSFENSIAGTFPTEFGDMKFLSFTRMGRNFMNGTIPSEIGNLEKLQEMWVHRNLFTGTMPSEIGKMRDMGDLRLHFNMLSGSVPEEHYSMPQLRRWDLYDNNLTSTISTKIGMMSTLQTYRIRENSFYGSIPTEMGNLVMMKSAWLHYNQLKGTVPLELCMLRGQQAMTVLDVDCGPTNSIGSPYLNCMLECCTGCCDPVTLFCLRDNYIIPEDSGVRI
jgi:hypothetical protein